MRNGLHRLSVRHMRLWLLCAQGCFNQSLDHFDKLERISELDLDLPPASSRSSTVQNTTGQPRPKLFSLYSMAAFHSNPTHTKKHHSGYTEQNAGQNHHTISSAGLTDCLSPSLAVCLYLLLSAWWALLSFYCLASCSSCLTPIHCREENCKAQHWYAPFCWFRVT